MGQKLSEEQIVEICEHYNSLPRLSDADVQLVWTGKEITVCRGVDQGLCRMVNDGRFYDEWTVYDPDDGQLVPPPTFLLGQRVTFANAVSIVLSFIGA